MTDSGSKTAPDAFQTTRRGLLALVGSGVLAGCGGFGEVGSSGEATINSHNLPDIRRHEEIESPIQPAVPVEIAAPHIDASRTRVYELLTELPTPFEPEDIPNGHIRQQLTDAASDASDGLDDARTAKTGFVTLRSLRYAREHARYAAAGWAVANRDLTAAPLREEHSRAVSDAQSTMRDHEYLGADPIRAVLVHAHIETALERATSTDIPPRSDSELLSVAEWGETAESAQTYLNDARHMTTQLTASLPNDARSVEDTLVRAAERLLSDLRNRRSNLPPEPTSQERNPGQMVAEELRWKAETEIGTVDDAHGPANAVVHANTRLTRFRALNRIKARRDAGELSRPEDAATVRTIRQTAYEALTSALESDANSGLIRTAIVDAGYQVMGADRELSYLQGEVDATRLDDTIAGYWHATALARSAPAAARQTVAELRSG